MLSIIRRAEPMRTSRLISCCCSCLVLLTILLIGGCADHACVDCDEGCQTFAFILRDDYSGCRPPDCTNHYWYFELRGGDWKYVGEWDEGSGASSPHWVPEVRRALDCYTREECHPYDRSYSEDLTSTPRENIEAEEATLWLSGSLVAPDDLYYKLVGHFASIREEYGDQIPKLRSTPFRSHWDSESLVLTVTEEAMQRYEIGEFHDLDSLNALFGTTRIQALAGRAALLLEFERRYNPYRLAEIYESVACVQDGKPVCFVRSPAEMGNLIPWVTSQPLPLGFSAAGPFH